MNQYVKATLAGAVILAMGAAPNVAQEGDVKMLSGGDIEWSPAPNILPEGVEVAILAGNPEEGLFVMRARIPDGTRIAPHWESATRHITVIEGTFHLGVGETFNETDVTVLTAGAFFSMPAEQPHFAWTEGTTVLQSVGIGSSEFHYVNPEDDPSQQATQ